MALTLDRRTEVEAKALEVLGEFQINSLPIDPARLARGKNYHVEYRDLSEENFRGVLSGKKIAIDSTIESPSMKRFIVAHELGHGELGHGNSEMPNELCDCEGSCNDKEAAASLFARSLLMPVHYLEKAIEIYQGKDTTAFSSCIEYLSHMFGVTERRVNERLVECGVEAC